MKHKQRQLEKDFHHFLRNFERKWLYRKKYDIFLTPRPPPHPWQLCHT